MNARLGARAFGFCGVIYGIVLTAFGVMLAGAGHGTYLLLDVASAPVGYLGVVVSILFPPLLWGAVGWLLSQADMSLQRKLVAIILFAHYAGISFLPHFEEHSEGKYVLEIWKQSPVFLVLSLAVYLGGQAGIWYLWFSRKPKVL